MLTLQSTIFLPKSRKSPGIAIAFRPASLISETSGVAHDDVEPAEALHGVNWKLKARPIERGPTRRMVAPTIR